MNKEFEVTHIPVLQKEVLEFFQKVSSPIPIFLDATVGEGGHSLAILENIPNSKIILLDRDIQMLERAKKRLEFFKDRIFPININFSEFTKLHLLQYGFEVLNGILLDFGISSFHIKHSGRGFSFQLNEPLDMRLSNEGKTATQILNQYSIEELEKIFLQYGEENWSKKIAQNIVETRKKKPILTTSELNQIVEKTIPRKFWPPKVHPAFRIYQALRIEVNQELQHITKAFENLPFLLCKGGILVAISFHSLEDRITKQALKQLAQTGSFHILTKKPLKSSVQEVQFNPASRSARLRAIEVVDESRRFS
jgi:16S rRNA (cytosine1402-N4)-methyltransferase